MQVISVREISDSSAAALNEPARFQLDSAPSADARWSRWSYWLGEPLLILSCDAVTGVTTLRTGTVAPRSSCVYSPESLHSVVRQWGDPLEALAWMSGTLNDGLISGESPPFKGGWFGYLSYDLGRSFECIPSRSDDPLRCPRFEFTFHDGLLARDELTGKHYQVSCSHDFKAKPLRWIEDRSRRGAKTDVTSNFTRETYQQAVRHAIDYIRAGDVFQVNLSQRFTAAMPFSADELYNRLRRDFPSSFGALFHSTYGSIVCNSPELFLCVEPDPATGKRHVTTRPIKGTRPRLPGMDVELRDSVKDQAELNMIVDLERNDLGRVCEIGSVKVTEPRSIEAHPTVYHGVATVEGDLRDDVTFVDLLRATFPGGSVTGAPKIRAMQIIEELEPVRRGPYCGAVGYLSADGHIQLNVAIRTVIVKGGVAHISVGGGIVADSEPAAEYEETLVKARAMFAALGVSSGSEGAPK
jgi:para-aminobenzoate synthetase component 1